MPRCKECDEFSRRAGMRFDPALDDDEVSPETGLCWMHDQQKKVEASEPPPKPLPEVL